MDIPLLILMFGFISHVIINIILDIQDRKEQEREFTKVNNRCDGLIKWCQMLDNQISGMRIDNKTVPSKRKKK